MTDFTTMKVRIMDELKREDLSAQIGDAIKTAIKHYADERFGWNELIEVSSIAFSSTSGLVVAGLRDLDQVLLETNGGYRYELKEWTYDYLSAKDTNSQWRGRPKAYAVSGLRDTEITTWTPAKDTYNRVTFYPKPDQDYTIYLHYLKDFGEISATASTPWFTAGEELIRSHAKADLLENLIRGPEAVQEAQVQRRREQQALNRLHGKATSMRSSGRMKPWS